MKRQTTGLAIALAALLVLGGCTGSDAATDTAESSDRADSTNSANPCAVGDAAPSKALISCGETSVVFIETPYATGTGVAVRVDDADYVVTNLHVVDPFGAVEVSLGGTDIGPLPVIGADVAADIALLGPIEDVEDATPLPLGDTTVEKGDDVFLLGFPGSTDTLDADLTITSGIVSRTRTAEGWDQTYIQSDAVIGDGQSGGALFTATGELAGISGLAYDPAFALSLSIQDVERSVSRILDGEGDELLLVPLTAEDAEGGATSGTIAAPDDLETYVLYLPAAETARTWELQVQGPTDRFGVLVADSFEGTVLAQSATYDTLLQEYLAQLSDRSGLSAAELGAPEPVDDAVRALEVAPGTFRIEVEPDVAAEVVVQLGVGVTDAELTWTSSLPLWPLTEQVVPRTLTLDEPVEGTISGFRAGIPFDVELEAGVEVELLASSPQGDLAIILAPPGVTMNAVDVDPEVDHEQLEYFDDSGEGIYGFGVRESFTPEVSGVHRLWLNNYDMTPVAYRIAVSTD